MCHLRIILPNTEKPYLWPEMVSTTRSRKASYTTTIRLAEQDQNPEYASLQSNCKVSEWLICGVRSISSNLEEKNIGISEMN
ncbi:unnamed protein product [Rhizophagus irregularis]|nr:unnamed protein product [Rhizophagus irregularis]